MASAFKQAQNIPAGASLVDLYTVPAATRSVVPSIVVCNEAGATTFRISVAPLGAGDATSQYLYYDCAIGANTTFTATIGIVLQATDKIRVRSASGSVNFTAFIDEIS